VRFEDIVLPDTRESENQRTCGIKDSILCEESLEFAVCKKALTKRTCVD